jgi:transcriptional regulator with XRE-family HTH domain
MVDENTILEYNFKALSQERKKQKISQENAATQLTLSVSQIKSLENNLDSGFITPHFKSIALKRYAKFLGIDFDKIIIPTTSLDYITKEDIIDDEIKEGLPLNTINKLNLKISKGYGFAGLILIVLVIYFTQPNKDKAPIPEIAITDVSIPEIASLDDHTSTPMSKNFLQNKNLSGVSKSNVQEINNTSDIVSLDFICSIESASMDKVWSRVNPEKPATYFHIVSLGEQSICTIDNRGVLKQYNLAEGGKLTHRGEAPFKVQLNSSISKLYFQGWKVILKDNDNFIQLNPIDMVPELN